jgi:hypothetical protein
MKRQVEIEDTLQENVDDAIEQLEELLREFLKENSDFDELPCLHNDLDYSGSFHEIVDSATPIYTSEIEDTWYLYSNDLEEAYENAGVGDNPRENDGMAAIYFYISQKCCDWYHDNAQEIFDEWLYGGI